MPLLTTEKIALLLTKHSSGEAMTRAFHKVRNNTPYNSYFFAHLTYWPPQLSPNTQKLFAVFKAVLTLNCSLLPTQEWRTQNTYQETIFNSSTRGLKGFLSLIRKVAVIERHILLQLTLSLGITTAEAELVTAHWKRNKKPE